MAVEPPALRPLMPAKMASLFETLVGSRMTFEPLA